MDTSLPIGLAVTPALGAGVHAFCNWQQKSATPQRADGSPNVPGTVCMFRILRAGRQDVGGSSYIETHSPEVARLIRDHILAPCHPPAGFRRNYGVPLANGD